MQATMKMRRGCAAYKNTIIMFLPMLCILLFANANANANATDDDRLINELNLPQQHIAYLSYANAHLRERCLNDKRCATELLEHNGTAKCWGYERNCSFEQSYSFHTISCNKHTTTTTTTSGLQYSYAERLTFWMQADFGKLINLIDSIRPICASSSKDGSSLECSEHLRFCRATNIFFDFKSLNASTSKRYRTDVIREGQVGGRCDSFDRELLRRRCDEKSYLQSWASELEHFESYSAFRLDPANCDVIFERPTVIIKLDASVNMYHHFCDFVNLYLSQHLNASSFATDIDILWWDTFWGGFVDASFGVTWRAFSSNPPHELISLDGKRVCFHNAMLPLLARQRLGLYYNMPLIDGCEGSGLFEAFAEHLLHRLQIKQDGPVLNSVVRITLLSRSTTFRRIINEDELLDVLYAIPDVIVRRVDYNSKIPFVQQLHITHNSDIFIAMHGSGLTHLLFLPKWATVFEIYNCEDVSCYYDLARLRGRKYFTWKRADQMEQIGDGRHPQTGAVHKKFANYRFSAQEFRRLILQQIEYVRRHESFVREQMRLRRRLNTIKKSEL